MDPPPGGGSPYDYFPRSDPNWDTDGLWLAWLNFTTLVGHEAGLAWRDLIDLIQSL